MAATQLRQTSIFLAFVAGLTVMLGFMAAGYSYSFGGHERVGLGFLAITGSLGIAGLLGVIAISLAVIDAWQKAGRRSSV